MIGKKGDAVGYENRRQDDKEGGEGQGEEEGGYRVLRTTD
jgi:hypothetical protein